MLSSAVHAAPRRTFAEHLFAPPPHPAPALSPGHTCLRPRSVERIHTVLPGQTRCPGPKVTAPQFPMGPEAPIPPGQRGKAGLTLDEPN